MLDELSTGWSRFSVDLIPSLGRAIFSRGFDPNIDYDRTEIESMRRALENHPAVLLFSHRSYLDGVIVPVAMQENRLPPVHTFAGINLSFGFMGPLMRHSGVIFIRRKLDDPLYKYVLRQFVGYIVEKRFNLSWSIEGTRSRTGKMLPPKLGLLAYVADAYLDGRSDDILLQPVSISFDQLHETAEYAAYARGGEKTPEGLSLAVQLHQGAGRAQLRQDLRPLPRSGVDARVPRRAARSDGHRRRRQTPCAAEDGVRGGLADPAGHAGQRDGAGVGAAADHPRGRADARPAAPHPAGLAGLPGAQADADDQQRVAAAHGRRRPRRARRVVQRPSRHPRRRRPGTGLAHRARRTSTRRRSTATRSSTRSWRRRSSSWRWRMRRAPTAIGWRRSGRRRCGCGIC